MYNKEVKLQTGNRDQEPQKQAALAGRPVPVLCVMREPGSRIKWNISVFARYPAMGISRVKRRKITTVRTPIAALPSSARSGGIGAKVKTPPATKARSRHQIDTRFTFFIFFPPSSPPSQELTFGLGRISAWRRCPPWRASVRRPARIAGPIRILFS